MTTRERYLTRAEAAARARVDVRTIDRWLRAGRLQRYREGARSVRVDSRELDALTTPHRDRKGP